MSVDSAKYAKKELVIVGLAAVFLLVCIWFLFFSKSAVHREGDSIAQLSENLGDIRYRPQKELVWTKGSDKLPLMRFDKVFSGPRSSAKVVFISGQIMNLGPNSLVEIGLEQNQIELKIIQGSVEFENKTEQDVQIKVDQKIVKFQPGRFKAKLRRDPVAGLELKVSEGTPKVSVDAEEVPVSTEPIILEAPVPETTTTTTSTMPEETTTTTTTTLPPETTTTSTTTTTRPRPRPTTTTTSTSTTTLPVALVPPRTLQPRQGQLVLLSAGTSAVLFRWMPVNQATEYDIEISSDSTFGTVNKSATTAEAAYLLNESLASGNWHWRIRTKTESGVSKWSALRSFRIQQL